MTKVPKINRSTSLSAQIKRIILVSAQIKRSILVSAQTEEQNTTALQPGHGSGAAQGKRQYLKEKNVSNIEITRPSKQCGFCKYLLD